MIPALGIADAYGGLIPEYHNVLGFFVLIWAVLNIFFLIASLPFNLVYIATFAAVELCFSLDAASYFALADGKSSMSAALMKAVGAFGFASGLLEYYSLANYLCQDALPFGIPVGDTSRLLQWQRQKSL